MSPPIAWRVQRLTVVDSTNVAASQRTRALWHSKPDESVQGIVIVAQQQSAGQGQHGRIWESPPGGLYLTAVVEDVPPEARDKLALLAGVAAAQGLVDATGLTIGLRWPNDLILENKKIGGILCESLAMGQRWAGIIGIGLNVNTPMHAFSSTLRACATSLLAHAKKTHDLAAIERAILAALALTLESLPRQGIAALVDRARQLDCLRGKQIEIRDGAQTFSGLAVGLGDSGELLIQTSERRLSLAQGTLIMVDGQRLRE